MNNYNKLYNLVEKLKDKVSKLDNKTNKINHLSKNNLNCENNINKFLTYSINSPNNFNQHKKFTGLLFGLNDDTSNSECSSNYLSFIKLKKANCIINYSIYLDINNTITNNTCSFSLGVRDKNSSKIRIIKGSKNIIILDSLNNKFIINNTILYSALENDELCLIAELNNKIKINPKKSIIKILII